MLAEGDQSVRQAGGWAQASKRCLAGGAGAVVMIDAIAVAKSYGAEAVIDQSTCTPTTDRARGGAADSKQAALQPAMDGRF